MHKDNTSFLYTLAIICVLSLVLIGCSTLYFKLINKERKKYKKFLISFFCWIICTTLTFVLIFVSAVKNITLQNCIVVLSIIFSSLTYPLMISFIGLVETILLWGIGKTYSTTFIHTILKPNSTILVDNLKDSHLDFRKDLWQGFAALSFVAILSMCMAYLYPMMFYKETKEFNIINTETTAQVILYKDTEKYFVKDCCIQDNILYIDNDKYQLIDTIDVSVQIITLTPVDGEPVFRIISNEEFQELAETNSQEDTPS